MEKNLKCKFCKSNEELEWPENYKKGDLPFNKETGKTHDCRNKEKNLEKWVVRKCPECDNIIYHNPKHINYNPNSICDTCQNDKTRIS
jgi:acetyl-CoA carboxylase beta subunit